MCIFTPTVIYMISTLPPNKPPPSKQNTHSFQTLMEYSIGQTTYYVTKQASTNSRGQKLSQASFLITHYKARNQTQKQNRGQNHRVTEQYATKKPMAQ